MFRKSQRRKTSKNSRTNASTCTSLQPGQGCNVTCAEPYTGGQGENATWAYCPGSTTIEGAFYNPVSDQKAACCRVFFFCCLHFFHGPWVLDAFQYGLEVSNLCGQLQWKNGPWIVRSNATCQIPSPLAIFTRVRICGCATRPICTLVIMSFSGRDLSTSFQIHLIEEKKSTTPLSQSLKICGNPSHWMSLVKPNY